MLIVRITTDERTVWPEMLRELADSIERNPEGTWNVIAPDAMAIARPAETAYQHRVRELERLAPTSDAQSATDVEDCPECGRMFFADDPSGVPHHSFLTVCLHTEKGE